jgi:hypothetical protein
MNVIDFYRLEREAGEKPGSSFSHPALKQDPIVKRHCEEFIGRVLRARRKIKNAQLKAA